MRDSGRPHVRMPDRRNSSRFQPSSPIQERQAMAPALPLLTSGEWCRADGHATSGPVWSLSRRQSGWETTTDKAASRGVVRGRIVAHRRSAGIMATAKTKSAAGSSRYDELKAMLETRRRELAREVRGKIRDARTDSILERDVLDQGESSEVDIQDAIGFALIQMKAETLDKIDAALQRLGEGTYGDCLECGAEIAGPRLWALPFAVRCRDCEEARETV